MVAIKMDSQQILWEYLLESSSGGYYPETIRNLMYAQNMVLIDQSAGIVGIDAQTGKVSGVSIYFDGLLEGRCIVVLKSGKTIPAQ
ncbi:hypothetical protein CLV98_104430 [Dyadobacter jejuensis]|uniref:Uncharacterized protein n=1 Tax=Dyadobacter jejuensis TaxID=1082580 RepID=A0A316AP41_9BACT|nr:hypothetical protein [Dyadobacter jejuensis]PWJ58570.1 hypothetical protein CLV98_104430 [Dyadobacter jejuensis]